MMILSTMRSKTAGTCYDCPSERRSKWSIGSAITYREDIKRPICIACGDKLVATGIAEWREKEKDAPEGAPDSGPTSKDLGSIAKSLSQIAGSLREIKEILAFGVNYIEPDEHETSSPPALSVVPVSTKVSADDPRLEKWLKHRDDQVANWSLNWLKALDRYDTYESWEAAHGHLSLPPDQYKFMREFLPHQLTEVESSAEPNAKRYRKGAHGYGYSPKEE